MARAWNHRLFFMEPDARDCVREEQPWAAGCSAPKCEELAEYYARWDYVTGRAGRVSFQERRYCRGHAEGFAGKHGLDLAAAPTDTSAKHPLMRRMLNAWREKVDG